MYGTDRTSKRRVSCTYQEWNIHPPQSTSSNTISKEEVSMVNKYEYRLHQIAILINAYTNEDEERYIDEIQELKQERNNILKDMKYKE